jgi:hypothetical protein
MLRRAGSKPLLLAGLAAAGYYAYSRMSPAQKTQLLDTGKKLLGNLPLGSLKSVLGKVTGA